MIKRNIPLNRRGKAIEAEYGRWLQKAVKGSVWDPDIIKELEEMKGDRAKMEEAFYRNLAFGTGGLRGSMGAGTNRMNVHTVAKASQGLADYILGEKGRRKSSIAVSYDSRIKSQLFARTACRVFAANGIKAYLFPQLMPTPCLSFAVRQLKCDAGVMVTASHNPKEDNGYKVYDRDGCQITVKACSRIYEEMEKLDIFDDIKVTNFEEAQSSGKITYISQDVYEAFIQAVKDQSVLGNARADKGIPIVYSPLNGTGLKPVLRVLGECGFTNVMVVKEQEEPDGNFPTCPCPNPEMGEALALGIRYARESQAVMMLATDPDCDRVGIAVRDSQGEYVLLSGNETGVLLLDYICLQRTADGTMPETPVAAKTIVTTEMGERIGADYGVEMINVLTGFKFIGEQINILETESRAEDFIFGFEESYGYLGGTYVRDKDGVGAALLICEMCAFYTARGLSLLDRLDQLYTRYGFCVNSLYSYRFLGKAGFEKMETIMEAFRKKQVAFGGRNVKKVIDYRTGIQGLPKSDVVKFILEDGCSVVIRPSGTEPKLKAYLSVRGKSKKEARDIEAVIAAQLEEFVGGQNQRGQSHDDRPQQQRQSI